MFQVLRQNRYDTGFWRVLIERTQKYNKNIQKFLKIFCQLFLIIFVKFSSTFRQIFRFQIAIPVFVLNTSA